MRQHHLNPRFFLKSARDTQQKVIAQDWPRSYPGGQILPRILGKIDFGRDLGTLDKTLGKAWTRPWARLGQDLGQGLGKRWQVLGKRWQVLGKFSCARTLDMLSSLHQQAQIIRILFGLLLLPTVFKLCQVSLGSACCLLVQIAVLWRRLGPRRTNVGTPGHWGHYTTISLISVQGCIQPATGCLQA